MEIERELRIVQGYGRRSEERNEDKETSGEESGVGK